MSRSRLRGLLYAGLALLYVLHNDLWLWNDPRLVLGLPVGLVYHVGFCAAAAAVLGALTAWAWPEDLEVEDEPAAAGPGR